MDEDNELNGYQTENEEQNSFGSEWSDTDVQDDEPEQIKRPLPGNEHDLKDLEAMFEVPVQISAVLGRATIPVHQLLKLGRGAVIELDRRVGESIDIYVNNLLVSRGEVVVVEDRLGITMTEIIKTKTAH